MAIDLGDNPVGSRPSTAQAAQMRTALGIGIIYNLGTVSASTLTPVLSNGSFQYGLITNNVEIQVPTDSTHIENNSITLSLLASGADRTIAFAAGILTPSESFITWPKTLTSGKSYVAKLIYTHGSWVLISLVGGY